MDEIDAIRRFNRFYTGRMGLLSQSYLDSGLSLSEVRVLYELSEEGAATARDLALRLGIDEGYLSRIVKRLGARGWIDRRADPADARRRAIALTPAGRAAFAPLVEASRADVRARIGGLAPGAVRAATGAMARLEAALGAIAPERVVLRDLETGDIGWLIERHGALYARDEGFDARFEHLVAEILVDYARTRDPATERAFIAEADGVRLGSIFCVRSGEAGVAKLRLFLLVPEARGIGLGRRLLDACLGFAREAGYERIRLWTHESHRAACALYARNGFALTASKPVRSFGVDLVEQSWERAL